MNNTYDIKVELELTDGRKLLMAERANGVFTKYSDNIPVFHPKEKPAKKNKVTKSK